MSRHVFAASLAGSLAVWALPLLAQVPRSEPITPIEPARITRPALVELGKKLYFDPRLSKSGFISCNSCHNLSMGGSDNLATSIGHNWQKGPINAPTVLNSGMNVAQFWDGRAATLKAQAGGPIANPGEMAFTHELAVEMLATIPGYVIEFQQAFGTPAIDIDRVTTAIAAFEETLVTPNARFDKWLRGDKRALSLEEERGYDLFKASGCTACHNGPLLGGNSYQKVGLIKPYANQTDPGRSAVTKDDDDKFKFKVPSLRNIAATHPYFHDGKITTLHEAVRTMANLQLGLQLTPEVRRRVGRTGSP